MDERAPLLRGLGRVHQKGPMPVAMLTLAYSGTGPLLVRVADETLTLTRAGTVTTIALDDTLTLAALTDALTAALPGLTAVLADASYAPVLAATLLEDGPRAVGASADGWHVWTNPLWRLLEPMRRHITTRLPLLDIAIDQLNLLKAGGYFADLWGTHLGVDRHDGEDDGLYTARQLRETLRPRESNLALAAILTEDHGVRVREVRNLARDLFLPSRTPLRGRYLPGWRYNVCTAEVRLEDFPSTAVVASAHAHAASGITVFVIGEDAVTAPLEDGVAFTTTPLQIGEAPPMQIGTGQIGIGKIGT